jgi:hypothetical protein
MTARLKEGGFAVFFDEGKACAIYVASGFVNCPLNEASPI